VSSPGSQANGVTAVAAAVMSLVSSPGMSSVVALLRMVALVTPLMIIATQISNMIILNLVQGKRSVLVTGMLAPLVLALKSVDLEK